MSLFSCLYLVVVPVGGYSQAELTADAVKRRLLERLGDKKAEKLQNAGRSPDEVVKQIFILAVLLALMGLLVCIILKKAVLALLVVPLLFLVGIVTGEWSAMNSFKKWQAGLAEGITVLVDFMPAFLELPTATYLSALEQTIPFLSEPLKTEIMRTYWNIKRTGRADEAFSALARKSGERCIEAICIRLATAWDASVTTEIFADLQDEIENAKEIAATKATTSKSGMFALVAILGLAGMALVGLYPAAMWFGKTMSSTLGG